MRKHRYDILVDLKYVMHNKVEHLKLAQKVESSKP